MFPRNKIRLQTVDKHWISRFDAAIEDVNPRTHWITILKFLTCKNRDADNLRYLTQVNTSLSRQSCRHLAEIERLASAHKKQQVRRRDWISWWRRTKYNEQLELCWNRNVSNSRIWRERMLFWLPHTAGDTSWSTLRKISVASEVSSSPQGPLIRWPGRSLLQKEEQTEFGSAREAPFCLVSQGGPAQNSPNNSKTKQRLRATRELPSFATTGRDPVQEVNRKTVLVRRKKPEELSSRSFRIQRLSWFGRYLSKVKFAPVQVWRQSHGVYQWRRCRWEYGRNQVL